MANTFLSRRAAFMPMQTLAFGSIGSSYTAMGAAIPFPLRQWVVTNGTNSNIIFSLDGVTQHFILLPSTSYTNDININQTEKIFNIPQYTILYAQYESGAPSSGSCYFMGMYGDPRSL